MTRRETARTGRGRSAPHRDGGDAESDDPLTRARQICLRLLAAKARTRADLATALARHGIDDDVAGQVLARFCEVGLIDDAAFAESYVHSGHTYRGLGRRALTAQLRRRGVDEQTTGEAVAAVEPQAEEEMARTLVRRRLAGSTPPTRAGTDGGAGAGDDLAVVRKLVGMLARRGYPEGLSYRVVREELRAAGRDTALIDEAVETSTD